MKFVLPLGILATVCACQSAPPEPAITNVASAGAVNVLTLPAAEGFALSSRNFGMFTLRGQCLVLSYDKREFTPVFKETSYPVKVTDKTLNVYAIAFPLGKDLLLTGLVPIDARADIPAECPQILIFVPSIQPVDR